MRGRAQFETTSLNDPRFGFASCFILSSSALFSLTNFLLSLSFSLSHRSREWRVWFNLVRFHSRPALVSLWGKFKFELVLLSSSLDFSFGLTDFAACFNCGGCLLKLATPFYSPAFKLNRRKEKNASSLLLSVRVSPDSMMRGGRRRRMWRKRERERAKERGRGRRRTTHTHTHTEQRTKNGEEREKREEKRREATS